MNIRDVKASLEYLFKAELTAFLWGHAGRGKTSLVKQYAKEKGYKFFPFYLGTQSDLGDVLGLAEFVDNEDGTKSTAFAMPKWMKETIEYCEANPDSGAIIFLDEFNRARRDVLNGMFSLALDKTFHTIKLPKNCHIIAAGNPPTEEYFVTDVDETALMGRFVHIKFEPSFQEWLDYAKGTETNTNLIEFYRNQPQLLEDNRKDFNLPVKRDARAVERLDRLMKVKTPTHLFEQLMTGIVGLEVTVAYQQFLNEQEKPLSAKDVLTGKGVVALKKWSNPADITASLLNLTCENLCEYLNAEEKAGNTLSVDDKKNLMNFFRIIPKDISFAFMSKLLKEHRNKMFFQSFGEDPLYKEEIAEIARSARSAKQDEKK